MEQENITQLQTAVERMHNCTAQWIEPVQVKEEFQDQIVWKGVVQVFKLIDHPSANKCYAWSYIIDELGKRKFIAVLHEGPVNSPQNAVKAAIVNEFKKQTAP